MPVVGHHLPGTPGRLLAPLFAYAERRHLRTNQLLFAAGDQGDGCYRLERGAMTLVVLSQKDQERIVAILGPGSIIGELSMIDGLPRSATVRALQECVLTF